MQQADVAIIGGGILVAMINVYVFTGVEELPQVEIVTMPGLGHYPSDEKPDEFLAIVDKFLATATS